jgi:hypothetical protein
VTYAAVAAIVLLVLLWGPTQGTQRFVPALLLITLFVAGVEALRRQVAAEFPLAERGAWSLEELRSAVRHARSRLPERSDGGAAFDDGDVAQLERLTELHRAGGLDDDEFATAKQRVLGGV